MRRRTAKSDDEDEKGVGSPLTNRLAPRLQDIERVVLAHLKLPRYLTLVSLRPLSFIHPDLDLGAVLAARVGDAGPRRLVGAGAAAPTLDLSAVHAALLDGGDPSSAFQISAGRRADAHHFAQMPRAEPLHGSLVGEVVPFRQNSDVGRFALEAGDAVLGFAEGTSQGVELGFVSRLTRGSSEQG